MGFISANGEMRIQHNFNSGHHHDYNRDRAVYYSADKGYGSFSVDDIPALIEELNKIVEDYTPKALTNIEIFESLGQGGVVTPNGTTTFVKVGRNLLGSITQVPLGPDLNNLAPFTVLSEGVK